MAGHSAAVMGMGALAVVVAPLVLAQGPARAAQGPPDTSAALLAEVRALRGELAEASRASLRAQLLVTRVQLQEQRIIYFDRRRAEMEASIAAAADRAREAAAALEASENRFAAIRSDPAFGGSAIAEAERAQLRRQWEAELKNARQASQAAQEAEQRLRSEESDVAGALAAEQGRWNEFNARLDELERALPGR